MSDNIAYSDICEMTCVKPDHRKKEDSTRRIDIIQKIKVLLSKTWEKERVLQ